jgi:chromosome segregation ATPase
MAEYKFFNIGKANAEIERLTAELETVKAESVQSKQHAEEVEKAAEGIQAALVQAKADLETAKASVSTLTARAEKAESDFKSAQDKIANPDAQIVQIASRKALQITQAQGQPPVTANTVQQGAPVDVVSQYKALTNSSEKIAFYRKHKEAIDASWNSHESNKPK